ncbi:MAG: MotA/TolQ/ExbB proton channel family protein [Bacteroidales bacterium]|jgi:biopolymer transport protein ExbB|nr:MotA/TolQ/ExbB proton channel family protein [Bacteroidales bacterium]
MLLNLLLQAQTAAVSLAEEAPIPEKLSLWDLMLKGGLIMIPIFLLSVLAVYIFIERYFAIRRAAQTDENFITRIKGYIHDGKIDAAVALCQSTDGPIARMLEKGIQRIGRPLNDINTAIENVGKLEVAKLEKGLPALASAAGGAPMIGFLGTVTGMVKAFFNMAQAENIDIKILSSGIYEAMVTTVAGLIVGIVAYFGYNILVASVEKVVNSLEASTTEFMDLLNEPTK